MVVSIEEKFMKALSIIGIVFSVLGLAVSVAILDQGNGGGGPCFVLFLYFLAFSITATVVSYRKQRINT